MITKTLDELKGPYLRLGDCLPERETYSKSGKAVLIDGGTRRGSIWVPVSLCYLDLTDTPQYAPTLCMPLWFIAKEGITVTASHPI